MNFSNVNTFSIKDRQQFISSAKNLKANIFVDVQKEYFI